MFLTALEHLEMPDPNGALAVNERTSAEILRYSAKLLSNGVTHPAFYNDKVIIDSLVENYGCERCDAVNYIHTTCAEISIIGKSKSHSTPFVISLPKILLETAKEIPEFQNTDSLIEIYADKIKREVILNTEKYFMRMLEASRIGNEPMRAYALVDDCIKRGLSVYEGGEKYTFIQPIFVGFATAVDSLAAIDELVYQQKKYSLSELCEIVKNDFRNEEELRHCIINKIPHYGNDIEKVDMLARSLADRINQLLKDKDMPGRKYMMPGTFSYINHALEGSVLGATFDGRRAGVSLSDGCCAVQGRDIFGPTAMIKSLTSWDQSEFLGGMVVNIKFAKEHLTEKNIENFIALMHGFIKRGGIEMQVNCVDKKTLINAQKEPEKYKNLIVRIGGYSDYFTRLSTVLQNEIIERTEY